MIFDGIVVFFFNSDSCELDEDHIFLPWKTKVCFYWQNSSLFCLCTSPVIQIII